MVDDIVRVGPLLINGQLGDKDALGHLPGDPVSLHEPLDLFIRGDVDQKEFVEEDLQVGLNQQRNDHLDDDLRVSGGLFLHQADKFLVNRGMGKPAPTPAFFRPSSTPPGLCLFFPEGFPQSIAKARVSYGDQGLGSLPD